MFIGLLPAAPSDCSHRHKNREEKQKKRWKLKKNLGTSLHTPMCDMISCLRNRKSVRVNTGFKDPPTSTDTFRAVASHFVFALLPPIPTTKKIFWVPECLCCMCSLRRDGLPSGRNRLRKAKHLVNMRQLSVIELSQNRESFVEGL